MEMEFDQLNSLSVPRRGLRAQHFGRPDWAGLKARLRASREAWSAMALSADAGRRTSVGSFDREVAHLLIDWDEALLAVNPTASGNRNADRDIKVYVAGENRTGDRG